MLIMLVIAGAFCVTLLLSWRTTIHPAAYGCAMPFVAAAIMIVLLMILPIGNSTAPVAVPFIAIFAALGSMPGAMIGGSLRSRDTGWRP